MNKTYKNLFDEYVKELDNAVSFEEDKLDSIREKLFNEGKSEEEIENFIMGKFDPICCSGRVIAVFRKYWLKCNQLNAHYNKNGSSEYVNPKIFTIDWLSNDGDPYELFELMNGMPYFPIGIDENGDYC
ncbi:MULTISPECIES: hypothetical protein [Bacillaceae]|uniref:Uncharacterized protein n=1 Tax=Gottfriedia luciferensis TaxID=178774 RepID=A0ABX2ZNC9_9BACI|nr:MULTISPECIES: hypothetical protein [Bacillaceae]ODG91235.1 hypothetical protein BED47_06115 [Gottfriedia luciferensis]PGZ84341.1 hypothetical protein COE53_23665 [Bacillus sp. AFS029533]SFD84401.1 hypothetical protein SAMN02799633_04971 [Bacillus sp. UNCCL81]